MTALLQDSLFLYQVTSLWLGIGSGMHTQDTAGRELQARYLCYVGEGEAYDPPSALQLSS